MSQTRDTVIEYIKTALKQGIAAEFFGKSEATVKSWLKTGQIPGGAFEKVLDAVANGPMEAEFASEEDALAAAPEPVQTLTWNGQVEHEIENLYTLVNQLLARVNFLEGNGPPVNANAFAPPPAQRGAGQQVFEPNPRESNVGSFVRPGGAVIGSIPGSLKKPVLAPHENPNLPSWIKPRPIKRS